MAGFAVGVLTGFFGVGGGFLIVPVLTLWLEVGFRHAVATSLVVITLGKSFAAVVGAVALFLLVDVLVLGGPPGT